jgi:hypothetical protein
MNPIIEFLKQTEGSVFINEDGLKNTFKLLAPLTEQELARFEEGLPCRPPDEYRELLRFASGFEGVLGGVSFVDAEGFGLEDVFPNARTLAADGFGNSWVVDLTSESRSFGPIFYACHDAPVIVYQTDGLFHFIQEAIRMGNDPWTSEIDQVHENLAGRIWRENPGVLSFTECLSLGDPDLKEFAESLDATWEFIDLRKPKLGDGFSWGRYGPKTANRRHREKRIFAYQRQSLGRRFLNAFR